MCQPDVIPARQAAALVNASAKVAAMANADAAENVPQREISWKELALHDSTTDAWIAIKGRVYDVTAFAEQHPGGDIIFTAAGSDATDVFAGFHTGTSAAALLAPLCVGRIEAPASPLLQHVSVDYVRDVQTMRSRVHAMQLFDSSKLYYVYKLLSNVALCAASVALALALPGSTVAAAVAGAVMALFWQQCGWLAHDFLHHQVFRNRAYNNAMGVLVGNIFQGYSVNWWKNKHNHHHAVPNVTDAPAGGDPDIDTMPILFWSEKLFEAEDLDTLPRWVLRNQAVLYWPILCFARISWLTQSALYQRRPRNPHVTSDAMYAAEVAGLALHYAWVLGVAARVAYTGSVVNALVFLAVAQACGGLFLGWCSRSGTTRWTCSPRRRCARRTLCGCRCARRATSTRTGSPTGSPAASTTRSSTTSSRRCRATTCPLSPRCCASSASSTRSRTRRRRSLRATGRWRTV